MTAPDEIVLLTTDADLTVVGDPIAHWTSVDAVHRFVHPGSGQFTAPASRPLLDFLWDIMPGGEWLPDQIDPGYRLVMLRGDEIWSAGPIEEWTYDEDDDANAGGVLAVTWADDSAWLGARVTYPDPTATAEAQTATARWTSTANAEDIMRSLVNLNAGAGALAARQVSGLTLGADAGVGSTVTWGTRFQPLADDLRAIAVAGGGLGFRTRQLGSQILFDVYAPADMTGDIRFSRGLGNLRSASLTVTAPKTTAALVAGQGEGTDRTIWERTTASAWGRFETFLDQRSTDDTTELQQAGDEALAEGGEAVRLQTVTVDTDDVRYGRDYQLGDQVSIEVWPGREIADIVREAHLTATPEDGVQVTVTVGSQESVTDPAWVRRLRDLDRRLTTLEVI